MCYVHSLIYLVPSINLRLIIHTLPPIMLPLPRESEKALVEEIKVALVAEGTARVTDVTHQLDRCKADLADRDTEMGRND